MGFHVMMDSVSGQAPGATFKAKKAGGDVQKKGQLEPYAYIPLDPKLLSKKHRHEASRTFDAVVGGAAKGKGGGKQKKGGEEMSFPSAGVLVFGRLCTAH